MLGLGLFGRLVGLSAGDQMLKPLLELPDLHQPGGAERLTLGLLLGDQALGDARVWTALYAHRGADQPAAGLVSGAGHAKPVLRRRVNTRTRLRKPLGPIKGAAAIAAARPHG